MKRYIIPIILLVGLAVLIAQTPVRRTDSFGNQLDRSETVTDAAQGSISTTAAQAVARRTARREVIIQNTGTTVLKLVLGTGTPTQTVYHVVLKAGTAADDGTGGVFISDTWIGAIQIISSASGGTYVLTEVI